MKIYKNIFNEIISLENLFDSWDNFKKGKLAKDDVLEFNQQLEENIFELHQELKTKVYTHGTYTAFNIQDPKPRNIHKATVKDRIVHHAIFKIVNPLFEKTFISSSFSCRIGKGTHQGFKTLEKMIRQVSHNYYQPCFILKCDIKKFFASIDHDILLNLIHKKIKDPKAFWLIKEIINSFSSAGSNLFENKGLPLGNLTSQLFANIYLNELDQFLKNKIKVKYYARYTDDFIIISQDKNYLLSLIKPIQYFLASELVLKLHPGKVFIRKNRQGMDFLGYIALPHYCLIRNKTKKRIFKKLKNKVTACRSEKITQQSLEQTLQSYLGVLSHAQTYKLKQKLLNEFWFWLNE